MGGVCEVVAPTLIPMKAGDRVKTDRRDAMKLARSYRSGDLTAVWVPDRAQEALRDLVRARGSAKKDQLRARHRLGKFLLRRGLRFGKKGKSWGVAFMQWVRSLQFEEPAQEATYLDYLHEVDHAAERIERLEKGLALAIERMPGDQKALIDALQALRGVAKVTAVTLVAELGKISRFRKASELMGYSGLVSSEHSSGGPDKARRGSITKTGNARLRHVLVEAAWGYRHKPSKSARLRKCQEGLSPEVIEIAWKAQHRLYRRYWSLAARKERGKVVTAIARELLGFVWAIGVHVEGKQAQVKKVPVKTYPLVAYRTH
jgi:transposase